MSANPKAIRFALKRHAEEALQTPQETEESNLKRIRELVEEPVRLIVWTLCDKTLIPMRAAKSYFEAQRMVDALHAEKTAYLDAGGSLHGEENNIAFFFTNRSGMIMECKVRPSGAPHIIGQVYSNDLDARVRGCYSKVKARIGKPARIPQEYFEQDGFLDDDDSTSEVWWCNNSNASMAWYAEQDGGMIKHNFWRNVLKMPYELVERLKSIYKAGEPYAKILTEDKLFNEKCIKEIAENDDSESAGDEEGEK